VNGLVNKELETANSKKPLFHSPHEAYGVIEEEFSEMADEAQQMGKAFEGFRQAVHKDEEITPTLRQMRKRAVLCAAEAIQVAAMCDKAIMSKEGFDE
jgi:hypothetical protein